MQRVCRQFTSGSLRSLSAAARPTPQPAFWAQSALFSRSYAAASGLSRPQIQDRILEVLKTFEKVSPEKVRSPLFVLDPAHARFPASPIRPYHCLCSTQVTPEASFTKDLGLDSLDAVEVVMAIEEEFAVEMSDEEAEFVFTLSPHPVSPISVALLTYPPPVTYSKITTVGEAISYIEKTPEGALQPNPSTQESPR